MELINRLAGSTWTTSLAFPDKYEHIVTSYRRDGGRIVGLGKAQSAGEMPMALKSTFASTATPGELSYDDYQGKNHLQGRVTRQGNRVIIEYGAAGDSKRLGREELVFDNESSIQGTSFYDGKLILDYKMRRVAPPTPQLALQGNDPVLLTRGTKQAGDETLSANHLGYRYTFAKSSTLSEFRRDPERFGIQFGGACMNMGPLSGRGQTSIYEVFDQRLYLFASESCRRTFLSDPKAFIDQPEKPFAVSPEKQRAALTILDRASKAHGDLDRAKSIFRERYEPYKQGDKMNRYDIANWSNFKDSFRQCEAYPGAAFIVATSPTSSWMGTLHEPGTLVASERDYFVRQNMRDPLALLRNRRMAGFRAEALGRADVGSHRSLNAVRVHFKGVNAILYFDSKTHRVAAMKHRGRLIKSENEVTKVFDDYRRIGNVWVPFRVAAESLGRPVAFTQYAEVAIGLPASVIPDKSSM